MKDKICVFTGSRAEYGLLKHLMFLLQKSEEFELQIIATAMHLSPEFGLTYQEIEGDGFFINRKIEMLMSADTPSSISKSVGIGMISFSDAIQELKPDLLILLGDRSELLSIAPVCLFANLPIAHIHGGEITEGAYDDVIRHSITKFSNLHFVATEEYRARVIQLGEDPNFVFTVGGLGADAISKIDLLSKKNLEKDLGFQFGERNLLVTFHPVTANPGDSLDQLSALLSALISFPDINLIFTFPNSDNGSRHLKQAVEKFINERKHAQAFTSLGQLRYLSLLKYVDGVVGNSSSGLLEAPSFKIATINIGERQKGRPKANSVIDCLADKYQIAKAIEKIYSEDFKKILADTKNPYGDGNASEKIFETLKKFQGSVSSKKRFYDIPVREV
jgi:GDP/UDP-N,N'-diacetylbacillosamine 2-epimerase (hydrolysing)